MTLWLAIPIALCSLWTLLGLGMVIRTTRRSSVADPPALALPAISVMKPLCGVDCGLRDNLRTFFEQDYPRYELVFGVQSPYDPAIAVVEELRAEYPHVDSALVIHDFDQGTNPKVRNLRGMLGHARYDSLLISDSNVRAPCGYLADLGAVFVSEAKVGLVTNLFAGTDEDGLGAAMENVQLNGFCAAGATLPTALGDASVIGKSMLISRAAFDELGGFERVADVLAEDYVIGKMFQHGGYAVKLGRAVLRNVTRQMTLVDFTKRHLRWAMLRARLHPVAYALEPLTSPLTLAPLAILLFGPAAGLGWVVAMLWARDVGGWIALRGWSRAWIPAALTPLREVTMLGVWVCGLFKQHVAWRGHRARLGAGTLLFAARPARARS